MQRHVHVIGKDDKILATYPITLGVDDALRREVEYFEEARRQAKQNNLVTDVAEAEALRFQFATGPR